MPSRVTVNDLMHHEHGKQFKKVFADPIDGPAFEAVLDIMNDPATTQRMVDIAGRTGVAPLVACVEEIEKNEAFKAAARSFRKKSFDRLKQAIGVACKLIMDEQGFEPAFFKNSSRPAVDRMENFESKHFKTARRYRRK